MINSARGSVLRLRVPQDMKKKLPLTSSQTVPFLATKGAWPPSALRWSWLRDRGWATPSQGAPPRQACSCAPPAATHVAEDHGLGNGDGPVEVTQGLELLISVVAQDVVLLDGVQCLLLTLQFDNVGVWDHFLGKFPHRVFKGGREKQHLAVPGQHPARRGPGIWHDPEFITAANTSTASPGLGGLHPQEDGRGGEAQQGRGRSRCGAGTKRW